MNAGRRTELEERVEQLETAVVALLGEYAAATSRLHAIEEASTVEESVPSRVETPGPDAAPVLAGDGTQRPTVAREDEATQAEVERAVRELEEDLEGGREEPGLVEP